MTELNIKRLSIIGLFFLIICLALLTNLYLKKRTVVINADGKGYYDYLPALFIYQDLQWNYIDTLETEYYSHSKYEGIFNIINGKRVNKYFIGTAILEAPFFGLACFYDYVKGREIDGYSKTYQDAIYVAAMFYLWVGLLFLFLFNNLGLIPRGSPRITIL